MYSTQICCIQPNATIFICRSIICSRAYSTMSQDVPVFLSLGNIPTKLCVYENHDGTGLFQDVNYNCVCKSLRMGIMARIQRGIMLVCFEFPHKLCLNWGLLACLPKITTMALALGLWQVILKYCWFCIFIPTHLLQTLSPSVTLASTALDTAPRALN